MEAKSDIFLKTEPVGRLMKRYAVPCVISLLVGALYNIVDQIFIANADYLGSFGNAANTVVFPLTVIALALAVMVGDGCCAFDKELCKQEAVVSLDYRAILWYNHNTNFVEENRNIWIKKEKDTFRVVRYLK